MSLGRSACSATSQKRRLPRRISPASISTIRPSPGISTTFFSGETSLTARTSARDNGWLLLAAIWAARASASGSAGPYSSGLPVVSVPVLSKITPVIFVSRSSAVADLTRMPARSKRPVAMTWTTGTAKASAQGQVMINTAMAFISASFHGTPPTSHQPTKVRSDNRWTTGA